MTRPLLLALAASAALLTAGPGSAQGRHVPMSSFDVAQARDPAETLSLCDLTLFLLTSPNLDADVIFAPDLPHQTRFSQPLRYPYFRPPNIAFDERVRQASLRLEAAGVVTRTQLAEARARYDVGMIDNYRFKTNDDRLFLEAQARRCDGIVKGYLREPIADLRSRYAHG